MFGLESQKKKKPAEEFIFKLEEDFQNQEKNKEIRQLIEQRLQKIKDALRTGSDQEEFDRFGVLLHGYHALLKVMSRFPVKKK